MVNINASLRNCRYELHFAGSQNFPDSHFLQSLKSLGSEEVNEVYTGNEQQKNFHCNKNIYVDDTAIGSHFLDQVRLQVDVRQWLKSDGCRLICHFLFYWGYLPCISSRNRSFFSPHSGVPW